MLWADATLHTAGQMLRDLHEAQSIVTPGLSAVAWNDVGREENGTPEVFDLAEPGRRAWDLAWTAINRVPCSIGATILANGQTRRGIREGIRSVVLVHAGRPRAFHSMGRGRGGSVKPRRWTFEELFAARRGRPT